jgi:large repetitive protein
MPRLLTNSFTVCEGDTFPTLKATVVGSATVEWFTQATGGSAVFTGLNYKPSGTVPTTGAVFYAQARSTDLTCPTAISTGRVMATINAQDCTKEVDLALKKSINTKIAQIGDVLTYTLKVWNESNTNATGVEVTDSIATTVQFVAGSFIASRAVVVPTIVGNVIKWNIGNIAANGDTVTLTYRVKATQEGVHFNTAEISKTNEKDKDSTPSNGKDTEDDIDRQCFTVPIKLCPGSKVEASVSTKYTNVQWFKDGGSTPIVSGNVVLLSGVGIYTYTATNQTCPAGGCCPIIIENSSNCCPVEKCVPLTIKKIKK